MNPILYRQFYRNRLIALLGGRAGYSAFFRAHPSWQRLANAYAHRAYNERIPPLIAARDWFDNKAVHQLGDDSLTFEVRELTTARRKLAQKTLFPV